MSKKPAVLFTYANDQKNRARFLRALGREREVLRGIWIRYRKDHTLIVEHLDSSQPANLIKNVSRLKEELIIFHFSGHADGLGLELETEAEEGTELAGQNLATILKGCKNLKLVVLNACKTFDHVKRLHEIGIPAVLATTVSVDDFAAQKFAETFYEALISGDTLGVAAEKARITAESEKEEKRVFTRDVVRKLKIVDGKWYTEKNWGLYVQDENILEWKLESDIPKIPLIPHELSFAPAIPAHFIGREKEIEKLKELLISSDQVVLVNGLGGVGKTTLAQRYYHSFKDTFDHILWTYVPHDPEQKLQNSSSAKDAIASESEIFERLSLDFDPINSTALERVQILFRTLQAIEGNNLLIIDNATTAISEIQPLLPKPPHWKILVTSRQRLQPFTRLDLSTLDKEEAKKLFYEYYKKEERQEEIAEKLLEHIGYHTLTIELLAKLCQDDNDLKPKDIFNTILAQDFKTLMQTVWTARTKEEVKVYTYLIGAFSISDLSHEEKQLLTQFSVLPSVPISFNLFCELLKMEDNKRFETNETLKSLIKKGWISRQEGALSCHQIIQEVLRYQLKPDALACAKLISGLISLLSLDETKDNPVDKFPFIEFGDTFLSFVDDTSPEINVLKNNLALRHRDFGSYKRAAELLELALQADLDQFGKDHPNVQVMRSNLALVYKALGRYERAAELLELALQAELDQFGKDHPTVQVSRSNLAVVYKDLGRYKRAAELLELALQAAIDQFGKDHPNVAIRRSNLALVYQDLGRYERAAELLELALKANLDQFGKDHPNVAIRRSNLALVYQDLGRYERAAELLELALKADLDQFGKDHPNVAIRRSNLALVYQDLGRYERAAELLELALKAAIDQFGKDHPNVARRRSNLGTVLMDLKDFKTAKSYFEKAYLGFKKALGESHPNTQVVKQWLNAANEKLSK